MERKRMVSASDFFFSSECPFWAPFNRPFMMAIAMREGKMGRRSFPPPDMVVECVRVKRGEEQLRESISIEFHIYGWRRFDRFILNKLK